MQVPAHVEYEKASSVGHALDLLARFGPAARVLAGGHSLIPVMKLRLAQPETLVDINGLNELCYLTVTGGELRIVEDQVHGGQADGIGMALMEVIAFDADGSCLGGSFMGYLLPTALDCPAWELGATATPSPPLRTDLAVW